MNRQKSLPSRNPQDFKRGRMEHIRRNIQTGEGTGIVRGCGSYSARGEDLTAKMTQTQATSRRCVLDSAPPPKLMASCWLGQFPAPSTQHPERGCCADSVNTRRAALRKATAAHTPLWSRTNIPILSLPPAVSFHMVSPSPL